MSIGIGIARTTHDIQNTINNTQNRKPSHIRTVPDANIMRPSRILCRVQKKQWKYQNSYFLFHLPDNDVSPIHNLFKIWDGFQNTQEGLYWEVTFGQENQTSATKSDYFPIFCPHFVQISQVFSKIPAGSHLLDQNCQHSWPELSKILHFWILSCLALLERCLLELGVGLVAKKSSQGALYIGVGWVTLQIF